MHMKDLYYDNEIFGHYAFAVWVARLWFPDKLMVESETTRLEKLPTMRANLPTLGQGVQALRLMVGVRPPCLRIDC